MWTRPRRKWKRKRARETEEEPSDCGGAAPSDVCIKVLQILLKHSDAWDWGFHEHPTRLTPVLRDCTLRNSGIDSFYFYFYFLLLFNTVVSIFPMWEALEEELRRVHWAHLERASDHTVRNWGFTSNGKPLSAFKPKQVNDTIRSVRMCLCVCQCFTFLFPDDKCSS